MLLPEYSAVMTCRPAGSEAVIVATPAPFTGTLPITVSPDLKMTRPIAGTPKSVRTVARYVTVCPTADGLALLVTLTRLTAGETVMVNGWALDPLLPASPEYVAVIWR